MAIEIQYGNSVVVLPAKAVAVAQNAEKSDLAVLLALLSDAALCARYGQEEGIGAIAAAAGCTEDEVRSAVAFWRGAGVISLGEGKKKKPAAQEQPKTAPEAVPAKQEQAPAQVALGLTIAARVSSTPARAAVFAPRECPENTTMSGLVSCSFSKRSTQRE